MGALSRAFPIVVALSAGCASGPARPSSDRTLSIPPASSASGSEPIAAAPARCPLVPLRLVVESAGTPPLTMLALDANGQVTVTSFAGPSLAAKLDPKGCLVGPDGIWAELTPSSVLWTAHERFSVTHSTIALPEGALSIEPDGRVVRLRKDGVAEPTSAGAIRLDGYREDAHCAGVLLLGTFLAMMPSMAVSDGHPAMAPVPEDSTCGAYTRP